MIAGLQPIANGLLTLGDLYGLHAPPRLIHAVEYGQISAATVLFAWLALRVINRTTLDRVSPRRRLLEPGAAVTIGALAIYTAMPAAGLQRVGVAVFGIAVAWLALEVCRAHGLPLDRPTAPAERTKTSWSIAPLAFGACLAGGTATAQLLTALGGAGVPVMEGQQLAATGITTALDLVLNVVWAAGIEDVVMVAAVTTLLTAARRPAWQIYTTVCVLEVGVHAYAGIPAIGMLLYAAGRVWLYHRYHRLLPMVAGHIAYDLFAALNQTLPPNYRNVMLTLVLAAGLLYDWWAKRTKAPGSPPAPIEQQPEACPDPPPPAATRRS
ncbi:hypothetical protein AOB60_00740 [Streptomyces noursei]|uniref:CAAX protease n=1 Tax=Streptomyces noursei TaxID=1971 RepID=A0A2N8PR25_STRNR|nr:hypothetical protein AOB60_00740 [Streptomyces noursei]